MPEFELIRQIPNLCKNNQMRDVRIEEISCDDPETWLRRSLPDLRQMTRQELSDGTILFLAQTGDLIQEFYFTPL